MISVIVPVYKVESYLRQCIDSILNQTYKDIEILLIDDGSPDRCGEICDDYAQIDKRIRVFHTENKGLSAARNLGLREANGEYIGFIDSDDWIDPDMYEILLRRLEETGTDISTCGERIEYQNAQQDFILSDDVYTGTIAIRALICDLSYAIWSKLYKKTCWEGICFPESHTSEDIATLYRVVLKVESISCAPGPLYHYRMRKESISHTRSMDNLKDYWTASYDRYLCLRDFPEFKNDHEFIDVIKKQVAWAALRTWGWIYETPKEQRDYDYLYKVSHFVRKNFPISETRNWEWYLRTAIVFPRYTNGFSFTAMYLFRHIYARIKYMKKEFFPS